MAGRRAGHSDGMSQLKKVAVTLVGGALVLLGVALLPLPGPGFLVIAVGLAVLATEYVWAQTALEKTKDRARQAAEAATQNIWTTVLTVAFALGMVGLGVGYLVAQPDLPLASNTGAGFLIVGGVILLTTTWLQRRQASTYLDEDASTGTAT